MVYMSENHLNLNVVVKKYIFLDNVVHFWGFGVNVFPLHSMYIPSSFISLCISDVLLSEAVDTEAFSAKAVVTVTVCSQWKSVGEPLKSGNSGNDLQKYLGLLNCVFCEVSKTNCMVDLRECSHALSECRPNVTSLVHIVSPTSNEPFLNKLFFLSHVPVNGFAGGASNIKMWVTYLL